MRANRLIRCAAILFAIAFTAGGVQAAPRMQDPMEPTPLPAAVEDNARLLADLDDSAIGGWMLAMQDQLDQLMGAAYRYGSSSSRTGFDCSGLVVYVFSKLGFSELPRSALGMAQKGVTVEPGELRFGDLVFFNTRGRKYSHVGIYTGNGRFVHAATSTRKVIESSLTEAYYRARFNGARRVIGVF